MVRKFIKYAFHVLHSYILAPYTAHMGGPATSLRQNWCEDEGKRSESKLICTYGIPMSEYNLYETSINIDYKYGFGIL